MTHRLRALDTVRYSREIFGSVPGSRRRFEVASAEYFNCRSQKYRHQRASARQQASAIGPAALPAHCNAHLRRRLKLKIVYSRYITKDNTFRMRRGFATWVCGLGLPFGLAVAATLLRL